jgi:hypothetical protein
VTLASAAAYSLAALTQSAGASGSKVSATKAVSSAFGPMVIRNDADRTGNPDETGRKSSEKTGDLAATHTPAQNDLPGSVDSVELENMLREINADGANVAHGWLP